MSLSRTKYDECAVDKWAHENQGITTRLMDPVKYFHPDPRFFPFGLLGGNTVSIVSKDMVGLESELSGRSFVASKCPTMKWRGNQTDICPTNDSNAFPIGVDATSGIGCSINYNLKNQGEQTFINQQRYTDIYAPNYNTTDPSFDPKPAMDTFTGLYDGNY